MAKYDYDAIRAAFLADPKRDLKSFSKEGGNPNAPCYISIWKVAKEENWRGQKEIMYSTGAKLEPIAPVTHIDINSDAVKISDIKDSIVEMPMVDINEQIQKGYERYAETLPERMKETFITEVNDPELLSLRRDIGLLEARREDLIKRVNNGESGQLWHQLRHHLRQMTEAKRDGDERNVQFHFGQIARLITQGHQDYMAWNDVLGIIEAKRRLSESERKRLMDMQLYVLRDEIYTSIQNYAESLLAAVKRNVENPEVLKAIAHDFSVSQSINSGLLTRESA